MELASEMGVSFEKDGKKAARLAKAENRTHHVLPRRPTRNPGRHDRRRSSGSRGYTIWSNLMQCMKSLDGGNDGRRRDLWLMGKGGDGVEGRDAVL